MGTINYMQEIRSQAPVYAVTGAGANGNAGLGEGILMWDRGAEGMQTFVNFKQTMDSVPISYLDSYLTA